MSEGMVPRIVEQVGHVAEITGNQASLLAQQTEQLDEARRQIDAVMRGAHDQEAQQLLAHWGEAVQKTGDAAAILADLRAKVERFAGNLATGSSVKSRALSVTPEGAVLEHEHIARTIQSRSTRSAELSDDPWAVQTRKDLRRKIFFFNKRAMPADPEMQGTVQTAIKIDENITAQMEPDSSLRTGLNTFIAETDTYDRFNLQEKATAIVDTLLDGAEGEKDMADLIIVHAGFRRVSQAAEDEAKKSGIPSAQRQKITEQLIDLRVAVDREMIHRLDDDKIADDRQVDLQHMYEQTYKDSSDSKLNALVHHDVQALGIQVNDRIMLDGLIHLYDLADGATPNDYNRPLSGKEKAKMDEAAAATIEGVHLLKTYGIAPLVVEGKDVGLPWDIAIIPPLPSELDGPSPEGALVDFILLPPEPGRERPLMKTRDDPTDPSVKILSVGDVAAKGRVRLFDDGQLSFGSLAHNVPSDYSERQFEQLGAEAAYTRLRALFTAMAFDAVVPEDVIRERTGGSVASQYRQNRQRSPREPLTPLLLNRQRELERAQVSDRNRQPVDWEWPTQIIGGHTRRLPEGYKPRPTAAEEARAYYNSMKIPFDGLPKGKTFVPEYKRGTGPERTTFRQAKFRRKSRTGRVLREK